MPERPPLKDPVWLRLAGFAVFGWLVGGVIGIVLGIATALASWALGDAADRPVAFAAAALLAGAALMSILEDGTDITDLNLTYPRDRPTANTLALAATVLVVALLVSSIAKEWQRPVRHLPASVEKVPLPLGAARLDWALVAIGALIVRVILAPTPLPPGYRDVAQNLALGRGYLLGIGVDARPTGLVMPIAPIIGAFAPGGERLWLLAISTATVVATWALAIRWFGARTAFWAALLAALLPSVWGQQLPESVATLAVVVTIMTTDPDKGSIRRSALATIAVAGGTLARPEVLVVLPVVTLWWIAVRQPKVVAHLATLIGLTTLLLIPWVGHLGSTFGGVRLSTSFAPTVAASTSGAAIHGELTGSIDPSFERVPRDDEVAFADAARAESGWIGADKLTPHLIGQRLLRGWDLVPPDTGRHAREDRGLPFPGGAVGAFAEVLTLGFAIAGWWILRRNWRRLLPMFLLPALFTLESALLFGDRGLRSWTAPMVILAAGVAIDRIASRRRQPTSKRPAHARDSAASTGGAGTARTERR